jgi:hypothetical protein
MTQKKSNIEDIAKQIRDKIDERTFAGWLNFTTIPNLYAKQIKLSSFPGVFNAIRNGDNKSLLDVGLEGCLFWLTDTCLARLRRHEENTISSSIGTAMFNGSSTVITVKRDRSFFLMTELCFYENTDADLQKFANRLARRCENRSNSECYVPQPLTIVVPFFENDLTDYDAVLEQIIQLETVSSEHINVLFTNLGTPCSVDNQPHN